MAVMFAVLAVCLAVVKAKTRQDEAAAVTQLSGWRRWRTALLILFPSAAAMGMIEVIISHPIPQHPALYRILPVGFFAGLLATLVLPMLLPYLRVRKTAIARGAMRRAQAGHLLLPVMMLCAAASLGLFVAAKVTEQRAIDRFVKEGATQPKSNLSGLKVTIPPDIWRAEYPPKKS